MSGPPMVVIQSRITAHGIVELPGTVGRVLVLTVENDQSNMHVNLGFSPKMVERLRTALAAYKAGPQVPVGETIEARPVKLMAADGLAPSSEAGPGPPELGLLLSCQCGAKNCTLQNDRIALSAEDADELAQAILSFQVHNAHCKGEAACPPTRKS